MSQVYRCDGCGEISDGGDTWFRLNWSPCRTPDQGPTYMTEGPSSESGTEKLACSTECFIGIIRFAAEDIATWASSLAHGLALDNK